MRAHLLWWFFGALGFAVQVLVGDADGVGVENGVIVGSGVMVGGNEAETLGNGNGVKLGNGLIMGRTVAAVPKFTGAAYVASSPAATNTVKSVSFIQKQFPRDEVINRSKDW